MRCLCALIAVVFVTFVSGTGLPGLAVAEAQEPGSLGSAVPVSDEQGTPLGSVTVAEVADPFTEIDPDHPAEAGSRYVTATVAFDADAGQRFDIAARDIVLQDDQGFLWDSGNVYLPDDAIVPELSSQTLSPGSRISGIVGFVLPEERVLARIFYQPERSRMVLLADLLGEPAPALGDAVPLADSEGGMGTVTVSEVVDPLQGLDPSQAPPDDARYVQATFIYENTSDGQFFIEPYGLLLRDANGALWDSTSVTRLEEAELVPDLSSAQLAPGDRLSGVVAFAVPEGVALAGLYAQPVSGQLVQLADLQGEPTNGEAVAGATPGAATPESAA